ncbi:MAG: hypothetical protein LAP87_09430 [Acidobacteriia bacterium]|nr:hypothetical protein [Terriglobia bacterium]
MNRDTIQKLLGGYATGTLTAEEREALFAAALEDQQLFDALAREQSLADLLRDPAARAQLLAALDSPRTPWFRMAGWWRPASVALAAAICLVVVIFVARRPAPAPATIAQIQTPAPLPEASAAKPAGALPEAKPERRAPPVPVRAKKALPPTPPAVAAPAPPPTLPEPPRMTVATAPPPPPEPRVLRAASPAGVAGSTPPADAIALFYGGALSAQAGNRLLDQTAAQQAVSQDAAQPKQQQAPVQERQQNKRAVAPAFSKAVAPLALKASPVNLGVQYRLLRQLPDGAFTDAGPEESLEAGTPVKFEIVPNDSGYLAITARGPDGVWQQVASGRAQRMTPFESPPWTPAQSGRVEFRLWFSRQPPPAAGAFGAVTGSLDGNLVTTLAETKSQSRVTYVVSRDPAAQSVSFTISLNYR